MQIQISWLLQKPTDLDLHCLLRQAYPGSTGLGLNLNQKKESHLTTSNRRWSVFFYVCHVRCHINVFMDPARIIITQLWKREEAGYVVFVLV